MLTMRPYSFSRITAAACRVQLNVPFRCTPITASNSSSSIFSSDRSLRIPALFTRMSIVPNESTAVWTMFFAAWKLETSS